MPSAWDRPLSSHIPCAVAVLGTVIHDPEAHHVAGGLLVAAAARSSRHLGKLQ